jgi:glycosyltransferase involved in cell wall biosynthesis
MALAEQEMLARYVTGIPTQRGAGGWLGRALFPGKADAYAIALDPRLVRHVYLGSILHKAAAKSCPPSVASTACHRADAIFDWYVGAMLSRERPDVVVAYENSALRTFRRAKRLGIKTVLDAASVHHRWQERFIEAPQWKIAQRLTNARKDAEVALADQILTVSEFARESYLDAGVPPARVHAIPVGVDATQFRPATREAPLDSAAAVDFRFVYVGNAGRLKGLGVLGDAVRRLRQSGQRCAVTLIGVSHAAAVDNLDGIERIGWMSHDRLARELPRHDVLVLPSYFDSFGMVVAEAMACGLPVIVTENVGAKEMVTPEVNGQVVAAGDAAALASAMRWFLANRARLPEMSQAARLAAEQYDWSHYRRRVVEFFQSL